MKIKKTRELSFFKQFIQSPYFKNSYHEKLDEIFEDTFNLFRQGQEALILKQDIDIYLFVATITGTTDQLVEMNNNGRIKLDQATIEKSFTLIWDAIKG